MELLVHQKKFGVNWEYSFLARDNLVYKAKANRTVVPLPRKITLYDFTGQELSALRQDNIFDFILANIPLMGFILRGDCPYNYFEGVDVKGSMRQHYFRGGGYIQGEVCNKRYSICGHTGNDYSIYCGDLQVASVSRSDIREGDSDKYKLIFDSGIPIELAAIFTVLIDITWHNYDQSYTSLSWERSYQLGVRVKDEQWRPKD